MNNSQLAVSNSLSEEEGKHEELFSGIIGTNEVTMGDPSMNLMPKFMNQGEMPLLINDEDEIMI